MKSINDQIEERIQGLTAEMASLTSHHEAMVAQNQQMNQEFQKTVGANQIRYQQLQGAVMELRKLQPKKAEKDEPSIDEFLTGDGKSKPAKHPDRVPSPDRGAGRNRGAGVGH